MIDTVLESLGRKDVPADWARAIWTQAGALRVKRMEPVWTAQGKLMPLPFGSFQDPETGRPRIRVVNVTTESYRVAREYMIRLEREDFEDPEKLSALANTAQMTPNDFRERYEYVVRESEYPG